jgi:enamine deaminase RidA (YjgF/YER057c/UK114 family)
MTSQHISRTPHAVVPRIAESVQVTGGTTIYVSGTTGDHPDGRRAEGFAEEVGLAIGTLQRALEARGASLGDLVRLTVYVVGLDRERMDVWHEVRDQWFPLDEPPAASLIGVQALAAPFYRIEIEGTAVI